MPKHDLSYDELLAHNQRLLARIAELEADALRFADAEVALRESERRFRELADLLPQPVFEADLSARFTFVNQRGFELYEYTPDDLKTGFSMLAIIDASDHARAAESVRRKLEGDDFQGLEYTTVSKSGTKIPVILSSSPIYRDGQVVGLRGVVTEISERRRAEAERSHLEAQLRQAQKMEAIGQLAGGIAHDFNNILTVVLGHSELLLDFLDDDEPLREHVEEIIVAGDQAAALTRQLLAFGRKQANQPQCVDIDQAVRTAVNMLDRIIGDHIRLTTQLSGSTWRVLADAGQLQQIIINLVINARDALCNGGTLTISTACRSLAEAMVTEFVDIAPGDYVELEVSDSGVGMTPGTLEHIFEPFFSTKDVGHGTGLGLSTVYGIIKQSRGHIDVSSTVGEGTTIRVFLPRLQDAPTDTVAPAAPRVTFEHQRRTILIVEDEPSLLRIMRRVIGDAGFRVLTAGSAEEALSAAAAEPKDVDLLVTDVLLPGDSGIDLATRLRVSNPSLITVFTSGYPPNVEEQVDNTNSSFLPKPFGPNELLQAIAVALRQVESG